MSTSKTQNPKNVLHPSRRPTPIQSYCPNHSDSRHTLTITLGPDAAILFHCVAGCTITSILTALKETYGVLFPYPLNELTSYDPDPARAKSIANALLWTAAQILMDDAYLALQSTRA